MPAPRSIRQPALVGALAAAVVCAQACGSSETPDAGRTASLVPVETSASAAQEAGARSSRDGGVPDTELPLRLVATVIRENPALSLATIEDSARTAHEVLNEGEGFRAHPRVRVSRIERGRILIDNDGVREQLVIDRADRAPLDVRYEPPPSRRDPGEPVVSDRRERDVAFRDGPLAEGEVTAVYEDGEMIGVQFEGLPAGGVYEQIGLRDGDIVTTINGVFLGEPTAAAEVLAELATSDQLTVAVEHGDGTEETLSVPTADFTGVARELD